MCRNSLVANLEADGDSASRVPAAGDGSGHLRELQERLSDRAQAAALRHRADRKSFRNEITPGNFTFRMREFEQAELEYFVPDDGNDMNVYEAWVTARKRCYSTCARSGCASTSSRRRSGRTTPKAGTDVEYLFPWGWGELESIAHRGTYDLDAHMKLSGKDLAFFDEATKTRYTPILIESSAGMDRTTLTMLVDAYETETIEDAESGKSSTRTVLRFHPKIAPVQVGVFPLARNKPELVERARSIERALRPYARTTYDEGNVGQLYRRQDEIGTPFCVMVDYDTLADGTVTVRERDSMRQERVAADGLRAYFVDRL